MTTDSQGIDLDRSTLAAWVGKSAFELTPVYEALMADLKRSTKLFMDETPAPVLAPGRKKTKTGYFWALARDDRPWGSEGRVKSVRRSTVNVERQTTVTFASKTDPNGKPDLRADRSEWRV